MLDMLNDRLCAAKPTKPVEKRYDGGGLYLLTKIRKDGTVTRVWQFEYSRPNQLGDSGRKKRNDLGFGSYDAGVTLKEARLQRDAARKLLREGKDPGQHKQQEASAQLAKGTTFAALSEDFFQTQIIAKGKRASTIKRYRHLKDELEAKFGKQPVASITVIEVKDYLQAIVTGGLPEKGQRLRNYLSRVFDRAVNLDLCKINPAARLKDEWEKPAVKGYAFTTDPELLGKLLRDVRNYKGSPWAAKALEMMALTFPRPHNINAMKWADIDVATATWTIPKEDMKMDRDHLVPLSRQAIAILESLRPFTGNGTYVFGGVRPLCYDAMLRALKSTGITTAVMTIHGFRKVASTLLNEEMRWHRDAVRLQCAHVRGEDESKVDEIYNKAKYWDVRILMMQSWADRVDRIREGRDGANVLPLIKAA
jgi:integrase